MTRPPRLPLRAGLALALGLGVAAASAAQPAPLDARLGRLADRLSLTAEQAAALDAVAARHDADDPAALWTVADGVRQVLTADQIARLRASREARTGPRDGRSMRQGEAAPRGRTRAATRGRADRRRGDRQRGGDAVTDAQRQALRVIRDDARTRRERLAEALRDGRLSDQAFADQMRALREDTARRVAGAFPDAAKRRAEREARREAAEAARDDALGLTADQKARLLAIRLDGVREAPERPDMRPYLDAEGRLDREAYREATRAQRQALREAAQTRRQQAEGVLTDPQRDLVAVHRALAAGGRGRPARRGRR